MKDKNVIFLQYPACSTCQKAKKFLAELGVDPQVRHIVDEVPTVDELRVWLALSGLPVKKLFNTSGVRYRELGLSSKLDEMSLDEQLALLSSDGKLVKRPLLILPSRVLVGFRLDDWCSALKDSVDFVNEAGD